jgi:hypothetical protein
MASKIESQDEVIKSLQEDLSKVLEQPVGRKSVIDAREVKTLTKSMDGDKPRQAPNPEKVMDLLLKGFEKGEIDGYEITRFETTGRVSRQVAERLGLIQ